MPAGASGGGGRAVLDEERVRCASCGCAPRHWLPKAETRRCCGLTAQADFEKKRRQAYPRRQDAAQCARYAESGVCPSTDRDGWCHFDHAPFAAHWDVSFGSTKRCELCTLPLPCRVHFPTIGEPLDERDRKLVIASGGQHALDAVRGGAGDPSGSEPTAENLQAQERDVVDRAGSKPLLSPKGAEADHGPRDLMPEEIVAALYRGELRYSYVLDDKRCAQVCTVMTRCPPDGARRITMERHKVFALHGLAYRGAPCKP